MRLILCLALFCSAAFGQVTPDQHGSNSGSTSVSTGTCVLPSVAANALVLLTELVDNNGTTTFNAPTATGLTFAQVGSTHTVASAYLVTIWRAYTSSSLGSTTITGTWNTSTADWDFACGSFTGTSGTAGNNGSDAIGNTLAASSANNTSPTVTVTSSSHNNSKYYGAIFFANVSTRTITKGANYTNVTASLFNSNFEGLLTEISTNPVTPAANTAVNGTISSTNTESGAFGVEILVSTGAATVNCTMTLMGVGPC